MVQDYETTFGDDPPQRGVNYWFYDSETQCFHIIFFSNSGPYSEDGNRYEGGVVDGALVLEGPARFRYELDEDGKIAVNRDGTITVDWWLRDEQGEWQPWRNTFRKVND